MSGQGASVWVINDIKPGMNGTWTANLKNKGSQPGMISIWISNLISREGLNPESETGNISEPGELSQYLIFGMPSNMINTNITLPASINDFPTSKSDRKYIRIAKISPGQTISLNWLWSFKETDSPQNDAQGDFLSFTINYSLNPVDKIGQIVQLPFNIINAK